MVTAGEHGEPILEVELSPGDLLYLPRGAVHHASSCEDMHSLHVTLSTNQLNTWTDLFELALPAALERAEEACPELRQTLPFGFLDTMGVTREQPGLEAVRGGVAAQAKALLAKIMEHVDIDETADQLGVRFLNQRLPPTPITPSPASAPLSSPTLAPNQSSPAPAYKSCVGAKRKVLMGKRCHVRLCFPGCARLVLAGEQAVVHHMMNNERALHMEGMGERASGGGGGDGDGEGDGDGDEGDAASRTATLVLKSGATRYARKLVCPLEWAPVLEAVLMNEAPDDRGVTLASLSTAHCNQESDLTPAALGDLLEALASTGALEYALFKQ